MIYQVLLDGIGIYESDDELILKDPTLSLELNTSGSFQFKMPPHHNYYSSVTPWVHDIEVYENDDLIFFGRPTNDISIDLNLDKAIYCEGALAYFNDSIQRPYEWESVNLRTFLEMLISNHNSQVASNRQFTLGSFPSEYENKLVYRKVNYETTLDCLSSMIIEAEGGYFLTRKEDDVQYLDWITEFTTGIQPVQYGLNIIDLNQTSVKDDFFTSVIPLGREISGLRTTIKDVNSGLDYIDLSTAQTYGRIFKVVLFEDIEDPTKLLEKANEYISNLQLVNVSISVEAAELNYIDASYPTLKIGESVHVYSHPHNIDANLPVISMQINLASATKSVNIGTIERRALSEIVGEEGQGYAGDKEVLFDPVPTYGSNRAVTSGGIFDALGNLRFSINNDRTIHVEEITTGSSSSE